MRGVWAARTDSYRARKVPHGAKRHVSLGTETSARRVPTGQIAGGCQIAARTARPESPECGTASY